MEDERPKAETKVERVEAECLDGIIFERNEDPRYEDLNDELPI